MNLIVNDGPRLSSHKPLNVPCEMENLKLETLNVKLFQAH